MTAAPSPSPLRVTHNVRTCYVLPPASTSCFSSHVPDTRTIRIPADAFPLSFFFFFFSFCLFTSARKHSLAPRHYYHFATWRALTFLFFLVRQLFMAGVFTPITTPCQGQGSGVEPGRVGGLRGGVVARRVCGKVPNPESTHTQTQAQKKPQTFPRTRCPSSCSREATGCPKKHRLLQAHECVEGRGSVFCPPLEGEEGTWCCDN